MTAENGRTTRPQAALKKKGVSGSKPGSREESLFERALAGRGTGDSTVSDLMTAGFEALDLLSIGLVVCGAAGQLLVANTTAQEILRSRDGLELSPEGVLCATHDSEGSLGEVLSQVAKTARAGEAGSVDGAFAVRRPSGKRALTLFIRAVKGAAENSSAQEAAVLVLILDAALPVEAIPPSGRALSATAPGTSLWCDTGARPPGSRLDHKRL